jgi:cytochrome b pre-mRNA-processing protein 3
MLAWLTLWRDRRRTARSLYGSIVTQARDSRFFTVCGVPDTTEGRFEMIVLHLAIVLDRLSGEGEAGRRLGQAVTEAFVVDVDDGLREMTVGDLAVPRHVKRAVAALHERFGLYRAALAAADDGPLTEALQARLAILSGGEGLNIGPLCAYMRQARHRLGLAPAAEVLAGRIDWPQVRAPVQGVRAPTG